MRINYNVSTSFNLEELYNLNEHDKIKIINQSPFKILRYKKNKLDMSDYTKDYRLLRSITIDEKGNIVCFSPVKSISYARALNIYCGKEELETETNKYYVEPFYEGTMVNLFFDYFKNDWEISTRSVVGAKCSFQYNMPDNKTFRYMFLDTCNKMNISFDKFEKNRVYSFVLQHPDNKIVSNITEQKLILTNVYEINNNIVTELGREDIYSYDYGVKPILKNVSVRKMEEKMTELIDTSQTDYNIMGYVVHMYQPNNKIRIKWRNPSYENIKKLKGNNPKLQYQYLHLRQMNAIQEYLRHFPEHEKEFNSFRNDVHFYTKNLYKYYISCYIKKEKPVKDFPYEYKTHMYHLHHKYIHELRDMNKYISFKEVINYVNNLEPPRLMHVINHQIKNK